MAIRRKKADICVLGLGRFGSAVVEQLSKLNRYVLALDESEKNCSLNSRFANQVAVVDGSDLYALQGLGVEKFETVIVAMSDNVDVVASLVELGVKNIIAKAKSERHARVLRQIGVGVIILPEAEAGIRTALLATNPAFIKYTKKIEEIGDGFGMASVLLHNDAWIKKNLMELKFSKLGINVVSIKRKSKIILPAGKVKLEINDLLTLIGTLPKLAKALVVLGK